MPKPEDISKDLETMLATLAEIDADVVCDRELYHPDHYKDLADALVKARQAIGNAWYQSKRDVPRN